MANYLTITEYSVPEIAHAGEEYEPPVTDQAPVAIGAGSLSSAAFQSSTNLVLLVANVACNIVISASPTAVADLSQRLPANVPFRKRVKPGSALKVAVIAASA